MKKLFLGLLFLPLFSHAQIGVKAGYTGPNGFHGGFMGVKSLKENSKFNLQGELIYQNSLHNQRFINIDSGSAIEFKRTRTQGFQLPIALNITTPGEDTYLYFLFGTAPSLNFNDYNNFFYVTALTSAGVRIKDFSFEARLDYPFHQDARHRFMFSAGYFFTKKRVNTIKSN